MLDIIDDQRDLMEVRSSMRAWPPWRHTRDLQDRRAAAVAIPLEGLLDLAAAKGDLADIPFDRSEA